MIAGESWLALSLIPGLGARVGKQLVEVFGSAERILAAGPADLRAVPGMRPRLAEAIVRGPDRARLDEEIANVARAGARVMGLGDPDYPPMLREIADPPLLLYLLGRPLAEEQPRVAIVGTRRPTETGVSLARELARDLAAAGVEIVSGMARGIDSAAHLGAMETGTTVAVLGCGIDVLYPLRRMDVRNEIVRRGTLVSEFAMRAPPIPEYFPRRNRIISGLSSAVVVVEAAERSGALLTANLALEQGRDVMAVPGSPASRVSFGPNRLIQQGAKLVMCSADVLEEIPFAFGGSMTERAPVHPEPPARVLPEPPARVFPEPQDAQEARILEAVSAGAGLVDQIAERSGEDVPVVLRRLLAMELRGLVRRTGGSRYERVSR